MAISYKRLWKLLIDNDMKKKDLQAKAGLSSSTIAKLGRSETVRTDILEKICIALDCNVEDIMEITHIDGESQNGKKQISNHQL